MATLLEHVFTTRQAQRSATLIVSYGRRSASPLNPAFAAVQYD
jgi:hypothetical protein